MDLAQEVLYLAQGAPDKMTQPPPPRSASEHSSETSVDPEYSSQSANWNL